MNKAWAEWTESFARYLTLERSLSSNSIDAYVHDVNKLLQWIELFEPQAFPADVNARNLQDFSAWLAEIGFSAVSQSRII
jgi:integrase/recombinase XerD